MKKLLLIAASFIVINADAQNVGIGTITPAYKLDVNGNLNIRGDSTLYIYSNRVLSIRGTNNIFLGSGSGYSITTGSNNSATGVASLSSNTTGSYNTANGYQSLNFNNTGNSNTACGNWSLYNNTSGNSNTSTGTWSLYGNTTGNSNTANGYSSLYSNTTGYDNTANGRGALYSNVAGSGATAIGTSAMYYANNTSTAFTNFNVAVGFEALKGSATPANNTGNNNTSIGYQSLWSNTTGNSNAANGYQALYNNTTGNYNIAFGYNALSTNTTGSQNTAIGYYAFPATGTLSNYTCIGYFAGGVSNTSNRIELGNTSVSWIGGQVAWGTYSDGRIKDNVKANVPGLDFINRLRPVTYNLNIHRQNEIVYKGKKSHEEWEGKYDIEKYQMTGFIAQEVESAAQATGYDFSGLIKPQTENDLYSIRYSDFVVPLVKAVQELSKQNQDQQLLIDQLRKEVDLLKNK